MALTQAPRSCAINGSEEEKGARQERPGPWSLGGQREGASREGSPALALLQGSACMAPTTHTQLCHWERAKWGPSNDPIPGP